MHDRAGAQRLGNQPTLPTGTRIVTLAGELFRADGPIQAGAGGVSGTISRPRQRRELSTKLESVQEQVVDFDRQIQQLDAELAQLRGEESQYAEAVRMALGTEEQAHGRELDARAALDTTRKQQEWQSRQRAGIEKEIIQAEKDYRQAAEETARLENEIVQDKKNLETILGKPMHFFAYPFGSIKNLHADSAAMIKNAGYKAAFTIVPSFWFPKGDPYRAGRDSLSLDDQTALWNACLSGGYDGISRFKNFLFK